MKKLFKVIIVIFLLTFTLNNSQVTEAQTLNNLYQTLSDLEEQLQEQIDNEKVLNDQKEQAENELELTYKGIYESQLKIKETKEEIETVNQNINDKNTEIENILRYFQKSQGIPQILKFIFGASDFNDLSRRYVAAETLSQHNTKVIGELEVLIENLNDLTNELNSRLAELENFKVTLQDKIEAIGDDIASITETGESLETQILAVKTNIEYYESLGCLPNQYLSQCTTEIPSDNIFRSPIQSGVITSNYGARTYYLNGRWRHDFHEGLDMANGYNTVYPTASGKVVYVFKDYPPYSTPGGNAVILNHSVNGKPYTSAYYHLSDIYVEPGDIVSYLDPIAKIGNSGYATTGAHLHFVITKKWRFGVGPNSYTSYSEFVSNSVDPRNYLSYPSIGVWFNGRERGYQLR